MELYGLFIPLYLKKASFFCKQIGAPRGAPFDQFILPSKGSTGWLDLVWR